MSNRRKGPAGARRARREAQAWEVLCELVEERLDQCSFSMCCRTSEVWFTRVDPEDSRMVVYPACRLHSEQAEAASCPGEGCLTPADQHALDVEAVSEQVVCALGNGLAVGFPMRGNWDLLDVLRPS